MRGNISRNIQQGKTRHKLMQAKPISRFWGNAARLEKINVRNKNKNRKQK